MEQTAGEIGRLKACINDLVSVLALPAIWSGQEPAQVGSTLLDALLGMLRLDFAYLRFSDSLGGSAPIEMVRLAQHRNRTTAPQAIGRALNPWLTGDPGPSPLVVQNPVGEGDVSISSVRLGLHAEVGVLVAGAERADFPTETEKLLLQVAASQATIALQDARLMNEQRRAAERVEQQVAERTRQLTAAEEALRRSEAYLAQAQRLTQTGSFALNVATGERTHSSEEHSRLFGFDPELGLPSIEEIRQRIHPEDRDRGKGTVDRAIGERTDFEVDYRAVLPDGTIKYFHAIGHPVFNEAGDLVEYIGTNMDVTERKRAEEALRRSEAYLSEAQRLSHTGSFGWDVSSGDIYWSQETFRILACDSATKPTVELVLERTHPEDRALVQQVIDRGSQERTDFDFEHRLLMPDGSVKHVRVVGRSSTEDESSNFEFVGAISDITAAKEAEDKIRLIIETVPALIWTTRPDGWHDFVSQRWLDYTGLTLEQVLGWDWAAFPGPYHPDDIDQVLSTWRAAVAEGKPFEIETRVRRVDGQYRWFLSRAFPLIDRSGHILGWYGNDIDIHDRKQAEEKLQQSEAYLHEAQKLGHTGSWALNIATGAITHSSDEHSRLFGFDPERGVPSFEAIRQRLHPEDRDRVDEAFDRAIRERTDSEADLRAVLPDGTIRYLHGIGHPVFNAAGELVEYIGTSMDVTERKRAQEALENTQAELAHVTRVATLGELTASIAHEINQPLGAMVNNASACLRWVAAENLEEARRSAGLVIADGHRAAEIIVRIRNLAKKAPLQKDWLDVNDTIRDVLTLVRSEVQAHRVSLQTQLAGDVPPILGDRIQVQQVVLNLMMNAIEAMRGAGEGPRELWVSSKKTESPDVLITVRDSGPGLDPKSLERLFDAFYTTKPHGLGMGLAISRSIVEAHGGRLWATANAPHGAVFQFTLPADGEKVS